MTLEEELDLARSVFVDTAPIIYYIQGHSGYGPLSKKAFEHLRRRRIPAHTSVLTLTEVLVKPVQVDNLELAKIFSDFIKSSFYLKLSQIDTVIAERAGHLRGRHSFLKAMDALQIACAISLGSDIFLTNDEKLRQTPDIKILILKDFL